MWVDTRLFRTRVATDRVVEELRRERNSRIHSSNETENEVGWKRARSIVYVRLNLTTAGVDLIGGRFPFEFLQ